MDVYRLTLIFAGLRFHSKYVLCFFRLQSNYFENRLQVATRTLEIANVILGISMSRITKGVPVERWEIALIKAMLRRGAYHDQEILAYFTRPTRSVNHRVIAEIRTETKHRAVKVANADELDMFLSAWPEVDSQTGLHLRGDELLIKAREAMIAAVDIFNGAGLYFRAELFIVTTIIAWTYLLHAYFRKIGVDYRYYNNVDGRREVEKTPHGADKFWELGRCLRDNHCPLGKGIKQNLDFIIELRHEIEHQSTNRIDDAVSAKLQACCINFNDTIKTLFGPQQGLERRLPIALQFVTFGADQRATLKRASGLPRHIETMMETFHNRLTSDELDDPSFAYRVIFVPKVANRAGSADEAIEFIRGDSAEADKINRVLLKEVERKKYRPNQIVRMMNRDGYRYFTMHRHTELWKSLNAKDPTKNYGTQVWQGAWCWYETWVQRVREHCEQHAERYRPSEAHPRGPAREATIP